MIPPLKFSDKITVSLVNTAGGDPMVVAAARVSTEGGHAYTHYIGQDDAHEGAGLINYLMKHRHGTPFEHAMLTIFVHAPIFLFREWHRHRVGFSYNEESARYRTLDPVFWLPRRDRPIIPEPGFRSARPKFVAGSDEDHVFVCGELRAAYEQAYARYRSMLDRGIAREVARACLPVGIFSSCWVTCNPRSLMHFLSLRTHDPAAKFVSYPQAEIEEAARAAEEIFRAGWPQTHAAFVANGRVAP